MCRCWPQQKCSTHDYYFLHETWVGGAKETLLAGRWALGDFLTLLIAILVRPPVTRKYFYYC